MSWWLLAPYKQSHEYRDVVPGEGNVMMILNLTAELEAEWDDDFGSTEFVIVRLQGVSEPIAKLPVYWRSHGNADVAQTVADWLRGGLS